MKIKVNITSYMDTEEGKVYMALTCLGKFTLCRFYRSNYSDLWYFFPAISARPFGNGRYVCPDKDGFPMEYFLNLCRSVWFINMGDAVVGHEFPEVELTQEARRVLNRLQ